MKNVAVLVASRRRDSNNMKLAKALQALAAYDFRFHYADIGSLPHYNEDLWDNPPASVQDFKQLIDRSDAVLLVIPEYNRGIPGVLKNALDWGSRPWGLSSWRKKPASVIGSTIGTVGTAAAQSQVRSIMLALDMIVMGQPEVYLRCTPDLFEDGGIRDEAINGFLKTYLAQFQGWIERVA